MKFSVRHRRLSTHGVVNDDGARLAANPIGSARFHSAWMSMMYQRLLIARNILSSDGVMVVAIDENEFASLSTMMFLSL